MPDPKFSLLSILFLLGAAQAVFLALALFTAKKSNRQANPYLATMLIVFAVDLLNEFLDHSLLGLRALEFMFITSTTDLLYGPLIWLYVRSMVGQSTEIRGVKPIWHFLPFAIHSVFMWSKISMANDPAIFEKFPALLLGNHIQAWIMNEPFAIFTVVHIATYLSLSLYSLKRFPARVANSFSYMEGVGLKWLQRLLVSLSALYILYVLRFVFAPYFELVAYADVMLNIGMVVTIYALAYFGLQQPIIFAERTEPETVERQPSEITPSTELPEAVVGEQESHKYAKSSLSADRAGVILNRLKDYMESARPYLDSKLTLMELSSALAVSSNHLSQVINEQLSLNFFDFVNSYRIEAAKCQLTEMDPKRYTILGLALDSGFNSKSAFYTGFKKHTGVTPSAFRNVHFKS